jgi:predicted acyl esterase
MNEPLYRVWISGEERPHPWYKDHAGHWVAEEQWPSPRINWQDYYLNETGLASRTMPGREMSVCSPATAGTDYGRWGGYGGTSPDLAIDQRRDDGLSLCFDTGPLDEDMTLLGAPELRLRLKVDSPAVNLAVRLCHVYPDGTSAVMTYGVLNLSHRDDHARPEPCPVGEWFEAAIMLNDFGRTVPKGHRLRIAIQTQFWFVLWPQPDLATLTLESGMSRLRLPMRSPSPRDREIKFARPEIAPPVAAEQLMPEHVSKHVEDDLATGIRTIRLVNDQGTTHLIDRNIVTSSASADTFSMHTDDPLTAKLVSEYRWALKSGEADTEARSRTELTADRQHFYLTWRIEALEAGRVIHSKQATRKIKRDFC